MTNAWKRQCTFPSHGYTSEKPTIWGDVSVERDSAPMVTDRHHMKRKVSDLRGNMIPKRAGPARDYMLAKITVEKWIDSLPREVRVRITPSKKWAMVDMMAAK